MGRFKFVMLTVLIGALLAGAYADRHLISVSLPAEETAKMYRSDLQKFSDQLEALQQEAQEATQPHQLRESFLKTRLAYKRIEFLLAWFQEETVTLHINGAPLPKVNKQNASFVEISEPKGLQILDEMIFSEESDLPKVKKLIHELRLQTDRLIFTQQSTTLNHRLVFEAYRAQLIRLVSMGITGFDTPMSGHAMEDAVASWTSMMDVWKLYHPSLHSQAPTLAEEIQLTFEAGKSMLEKGDFDTFDRLAFTRDIANPLYGKILDAQMALSIETIYEVTPRLQSLNHQGKEIFSTDFLDAAYFTSRPISEENQARIELGKMLFFDPALSQNGQVSCGTCHQPDKGFSDGQPKSREAAGHGTVKRNAPGLVNTVFADKFFHDLRADRLDRQVEQVIFATKEFNTDYSNLVSRLKQSSEYRTRFQEAFGYMGKYALSGSSIKEAIAAYMFTLRSFNSPVDRYIRGESDELSQEVKRGFNLFMGKAACGTCHFAPTFNGSVPPRYLESESEVLGVPKEAGTHPTELDPDLGRYGNGFPRDQAPFFKHSFKTPTVRNIALTAPYMHNGVYETLEEVITFYNAGGGAGMGLDVPYQTLPADSLHLTDQEQADLVSFMMALTDTAGLTQLPSHLPEFPDSMGYPNDRLVRSY
ncbi:cytochrome c peroxidase [Pontibacter sp. G13]|uniref:cytochrome-c peroxidase n=1 Tax=Pontibacter sp. G13 TaxID=3074898 RepID=UPI00288A1599|nr:cytochrome c peroxidase [Pontibacter sp. G13]WNJ18945.1 cytochrome c peroxidase [Pontibacter sp. G13]